MNPVLEASTVRHRQRIMRVLIVVDLVGGRHWRAPAAPALRRRPADLSATVTRQYQPRGREETAL
jgi:hypothetical protein